jgi:drug/metabolite transporter (DMT)-like permease
LFKSSSSHLWAVLQALFVTFLWATSWVIIKIGLQDIPALTFAGLRYSLAFLCLLPFALRPAHRFALRRLSKRQWGRLILLGLLFYTVTQGAQFLGLAYLPAVTVSLLLNLTTIVVVLMGIRLLAERPTFQQWLGAGLSLIGILIYFYPIVFPTQQVFGLLVVMIGMLANASSAILGRHINREQAILPLTITLISMGIGAGALLILGILTQGLPPLRLIHWVYIAWLAVVNTAFAFTLWNHTLRTLTAMESQTINSTMLIQIAVLAWIFLGEPLSSQKIVGMTLTGLGTLLVQLRRVERGLASSVENG